MNQKPVSQRTTRELVEEVYNCLNRLENDHNEFKEEVSNQITDLKDKSEKKLVPVNLEQDILRTAQISIAEAIRTSLTKYDNPLNKLIESVISENAAELRGIISSSFTQVIRTEDFKKSIVNAFSHKVARSIISNNDGLFDKVANELKQDAIFKSKMAIAVSNVVEECLRKENES